MTGEVRVLIVANNPLARAGLAALLEQESDFQIVGQIDPDQLDDVDIYHPDVLVWDVGNRELSAIDYPIIALLSETTQASTAWEKQPQGLLLRTVDTPTLLAALTAVTQGLVVLDAELSAALMPTQSSLPQIAEDLTPRELEVVQLLADGSSNKAIAVALGISEHTVKFHVNAIMTKLNAQSRTEAAVRATRLGLIMV